MNAMDVINSMITKVEKNYEEALKRVKKETNNKYVYAESLIEYTRDLLIESTKLELLEELKEKLGEE